MRNRVPQGTLLTASRKQRLLASAVAVVGLLAGSLLEACRKPGPDEIVNTGDLHPPPGELPATGGSSNPSGGTAGSSGAGGASSGRGGTSSKSASGGRTSGEAGAPGGEAGTGGSAGTPDPKSSCDPVVPSSEPFSKLRLLEATAQCTRRQYCLFQEAATKLRDRSLELKSEPTDAAADLTRDAWREAMAVWEEAELFQFGPAASSSNPGGQGFRDLIHSWPLAARCKVDEQTVSKFYETEAFFGSADRSPTAGRTLHALEYLLFYSGTDNGCTRYSTINSSGSWSGLSANEVRRRRIEYSARAAEDVLRRADALAHAWSPDGSDFAARLSGARSPFESEQGALNCVSNALFYVDRQLKDRKLALPLGLNDDCPAERCPTAVEAIYAGTSVDHLRSNLAGFRKLFQGCSEGNQGLGFDDWLAAVGAGELSERMLADLASAEAAVDALDAALEALIISDPARVEAVHTAVKRLTDAFKTEFITVLNLEPPGGPGGGVDND